MKIRTVIEWRADAEAPEAEIQTAQGHRGQAVDSSLLRWFRSRGVTLKPNTSRHPEPNFRAYFDSASRWNSATIMSALLAADDER